MLLKIRLIFSLLFPTAFLLKSLKKYFSFGNNYILYPEFSGRTAIYLLADTLKKQSENIALIPDYICNVVPMALEKSGFKVETYCLNDLMEPDVDSLTEQLRQNNFSLFVSVSVNGSSALIDDLKDDSEISRLLKQKKVHVLFDLCQNIHLLKHVNTIEFPFETSYVFSFNDKSFPGIMGAMLVTKEKLNQTRLRLSIRQKLYLYKTYYNKFIAKKHFTSPRECNKFEFSRCNHFPYEIKEYFIHSTQLLSAMKGIKELNDFQKVKNEGIELLEEADMLIKTKYYETSPYLILKERKILGSYKMPYAFFKDEQKSLKPDLIVINNKGYCL